jgi:hypothetical protein
VCNVSLIPPKMKTGEWRKCGEGRWVTGTYSSVWWPASDREWWLAVGESVRSVGRGEGRVG